MTSLIINMPHLQSRRQRHGAIILSALCWAWFLMPLVIVVGWLMGLRMLAQEVVWLGGWQSLLRLTAHAATIIIGLTALWAVWTLANLRRSQPGMAPVALNSDAATEFGANPADVRAVMTGIVMTVHFTTEGRIAVVSPGVSPVEAANMLRAA